MNSNEIRKKFLDFFKNKEHKIVESDLLVPQNDSTLLFTGAGMNQFKEQFMGKNITYVRAVSCQKCLRTADVGNVGKTPGHHTFFEMLGNFSFGDYFKKEAITWAWEFMTDEMGIPGDKLWISVYEEDEESYAIWRDEIKVPAEKIVKLGAKDNFWPANAREDGPNGPCGPCSEIFYDWGAETGCKKRTCTPACDCGRFVEVWNLVFTEFERKPDGTLEALPNKNIDTGMGLERLTAVIQEVQTNFDTDLFKDIKSQIKEALGEAVSVEGINVIADHIRAAAFAIGDGVSPSNEKQGYVIRKLVRRAYLKGSFKGSPFLFNIVPAVADVFKEVYPELKEKREHIAAIVEEEEKRFNDTLISAMPILDGMLRNDPKLLSGDKVFKLVDTYGLPLENIQAIALERKADVDIEGFELLMGERKEQSRKGSDITCDFIFKPDDFANAPVPEYSDQMPMKAKLEFIVSGGQKTGSLKKDDCGEVITSPQSSHLYAEAGGQVGDTGTITKPGASMDIVNTIGMDRKKILQIVIRKGSFEAGDEVTLDLDSAKKERTARNHTATHLLQAALRQVLGEQVKQSGSFVNDKRLRFDFTYMKKLTRREIVKIEDIVNGWISENIGVCKEVKALKEAKSEGALSFFGEKYGDEVRVVSIGSSSKELCGGTHVDNTGEIGLVKIISEGSIASGIRRIEAVTGSTAKDWVREDLSELLAEIKELSEDKALSSEEIEAGDILSGKIDVNMKVIHDLEEKIRPVLFDKLENLKKAQKKKKKEDQNAVFDNARKKADEFLEKAESLQGVTFVSGVLEDLDAGVLRKMAAYLDKKADRSVVLLGASDNGKAYLICTVQSGLIEKGISARDIIDAVAGLISGGGGGKASFAQAGGKDPGGLNAAIEEAKGFIAKKG